MSKRQYTGEKKTDEDINISDILGVNTEGMSDEQADQAIRADIELKQHVVSELMTLLGVRSADGLLDAMHRLREHGVWTGTLLGKLAIYPNHAELEDASGMLDKVTESKRKQYPILFLAAGPALTGDLVFRYLPKEQFDLRKRPGWTQSVKIAKKRSDFLYAFFDVLRNALKDRPLGGYDQLGKEIVRVWNACVTQQHPVMELNMSYEKLKYFSTGEEIVDLVLAFVEKKSKRVYAGDVPLVIE